MRAATLLSCPRGGPCLATGLARCFVHRTHRARNGGRVLRALRLRKALPTGLATTIGRRRLGTELVRQKRRRIGRRVARRTGEAPSSTPSAHAGTTSTSGSELSASLEVCRWVKPRTRCRSAARAEALSRRLALFLVNCSSSCGRSRRRWWGAVQPHCLPPPRSAPSSEEDDLLRR